MEITKEMKDYFYNRTKKHIDLVKKYYSKFYEQLYGESKELLDHDNNKMESPDLIPYIYITWQYYCKDRNIPLTLSQDIKDAMNKATEHHVRTNSHHPEYWSKDKNRTFISKTDRDKFNPDDQEIIDVSDTMPNSAIVELCADWCAMSEERKNTPFEWADKVIDSRWKFGKEKTAFILKVLNVMWN